MGARMSRRPQPVVSLVFAATLMADPRDLPSSSGTFIMRMSRRHRQTCLPFAAWVLAGAALVASPRPGLAQFGAELRLTGPPFFVSQTARSHAWSVATDDAGNVHVVYFDARNGGDVPPFYRRYDRVTGVWGPEVRLPDFPTANARYVAIAADCHGQVHVAWVHTVSGDQHVLYYKKRDAAGTWGPDVVIQAHATDFWDVRDPSIAADHLDDVYVVWAEGFKNAQGNPVYNIRYQFYEQGSASWGGVKEITNYVAGVAPVPGARAPSVAAHVRSFGSGSIAHVAWADYPAGEVRYRAIRYVPGSGTTLRGTVDLPLGAGVDPPSVAARCEEVHVAWADPGAGAIRHRQGVMTFTSAETTLFAPAVATGLSGQSPSIAVDGLGNVELVMMSAGAVVESRRSTSSGAWTAPIPVSDPPAVPSDPSVAVDTRGAVHVVWTDNRNVPPGSGGAYYDAGGCLAMPAPPLAVNATGPRAALSEPELATAIANAGPGGRIPVLIGLRDRPDGSALEQRVAGLVGAERRRQVVRALRAAAGAAQARVLAELAAAGRDGLASHVRSLWSANAVAARVAPAALDRLAGLDEVEAIVLDPPRPMLEADETAPIGRTAAPSTTPTATPAWSVSWIGAPAVWGQGYTGASVLVAIIDTGVDWTHADLAGAIWTNDDETPGNSIDDDGNGVVDDVHGWDAANGDGNPLDDSGHGTHVAGSVAGDGTGGTITGVAPDARVMAVKVLDQFGSGTFADIMAGVEYAIDNGAQVLNLSLGGLCTSAATRALLRSNADAVAAAGVIMCVAAANDRCKQRPPNLTRSPGDVPPPWLSPDQPAIGSLGGVTTAGATGFMSDEVTYFSSPGPVDWSQPAGYGDWQICDPGTPNVGLIKPDVSAPGMDVISTILGGGYGNNSGTSMATPHVAGLAALILSKNPQLTSGQVHQILESTALELGPPGKDNDYGAGRIRAPEALAATPALVAVEPEGSEPLPALALRDVAPNPAGSTAWLEFAMGTVGHVRLALYDVRGRRVRTLVDEARAVGVHRESWDGRDDRGARAGAGIYLARVDAAGRRAQRKFVWLGR